MILQIEETPELKLGFKSKLKSVPMKDSFSVSGIFKDGTKRVVIPYSIMEHQAVNILCVDGKEIGEILDYEYKEVEEPTFHDIHTD